MSHAMLSIEVSPLEPGREIAIAELAEIGFEGFLETDLGLEAYMPEDQFEESATGSVLSKLKGLGLTVSSDRSVIVDKDRNEEWEKNFEPVEIGSLCRIRAPFHPEKSGFDHELIIMPKMSFDTGHHATTALMVELLIGSEARSPLVDMGSGTAILSILARKLDIIDVMAIDIDQWAYDNAIDNCKLNQHTDIRIVKGNADYIDGQHFNTVLANINRNVLLRDMPKYARALNPKGQLLLSGFYLKDLQTITEAAQQSGLIFKAKKVKDNWVAAQFIRPSV